VNDLFVTLGIESWKGTLGMFLLPPLPFLLLVLVGARLMFRRRLLAWTLLMFGVAGIWLTSTSGLARAMDIGLLTPPRPLSPSEIGDLKKAPQTAIVVLGAGRYLLAPEYGVSNLKPMSIERLRYGIWLARQTSLPVGYSGGVGYGSQPGPSEAEIAGRIAEQEFEHALKFMETQSRDTNENAYRTLALLHDQGIERIVLVTHGFHMRRAMAAFERAKQRSGITMEMIAAPMGMEAGSPTTWRDWLPSSAGFVDTRIALHEWIGRLAGA
jgi:uncharacterized SAM-binding protein YcdF (DUF218 family)